MKARSTREYLKKPGWSKWKQRKLRHLHETKEQFGDYRDYIWAELRNRQALSPHYSLRNFANDLKVSPSHLSRILRGKKGISKESALKIADQMGLDTGVKRRFVRIASALSARSTYDKKIATHGLSLKELVDSKPIETLFHQKLDWKKQIKNFQELYSGHPPHTTYHKHKQTWLMHRFQTCFASKKVSHKS